MFSVVSVCLSVCLGVPIWPLPGIHWTSPYRDSGPTPTVQGLPPPLYMGLHCTVTSASEPRLKTCSNLFTSPRTSPISTDIWWPRLETFSYLFTFGSPTGTDNWWLLKHVWLASGRYTCYWNAFLLIKLALWFCFDTYKTSITVFCYIWSKPKFDLQLNFIRSIHVA